jgi:hypothetical protein
VTDQRGHLARTSRDSLRFEPALQATRLRVFGVGPHAEQTYRLLLRSGGRDLDALCDLLGRPREDVGREIDRLVELRLIRRVDGILVAEPPDLALGRLVTAHEERIQAEQHALSTVKGSIPQYVVDHASSREGGWDPVSVDAIEVNDLIATMETLIRNSEGDLRFMRPNQWNLPSGMLMDRIVRDALDAGRVSKAIYPDFIRFDVPEAVRLRADAGEVVRLLPVVPLRLAIFGAAAAILPEHFDRTEGRRLVVRHPALVRALVGYFELHWSHAVAQPGLGAPPASDDTSRLLEMLASGAKDEQMARALGVSLRTVRRRVAALLIDLNVQSRFQAGVEAVRRGWI